MCIRQTALSCCCITYLRLGLCRAHGGSGLGALGTPTQTTATTPHIAAVEALVIKHQTASTRLGIRGQALQHELYTQRSDLQVFVYDMRIHRTSWIGEAMS